MIGVRPKAQEPPHFYGNKKMTPFRGFRELFAFYPF